MSTGLKISSDPLFSDADYSPDAQNWYRVAPYGFIFAPRDSSATKRTMFLPINPSNLSISTHFATNVIPTIYGTVEEHSPVRYYDIAIEGTTGIAPKYVQPVDFGAPVEELTGRSSFAIKQNISAGGFFSKTINTAEKTSSGSSPQPTTTGLQLDQTGYAAFHNLYRFLLAHKKDIIKSTSNDPTDWSPLTFFNYKDANAYSVVIKNFSLKRDKESPMLYHYSIVMRGYDLTPLGGIGKYDSDDMLASLGLDGIDGSSFLGDMLTTSAKAKETLSSVGNGLSQLGR
jgi:hypothetical protein